MEATLKIPVPEGFTCTIPLQVTFRGLDWTEQVTPTLQHLSHRLVIFKYNTESLPGEPTHVELGNYEHKLAQKAPTYTYPESSFVRTQPKSRL